MAQMHVTNESPTKITLEMDPAWRADTSKTYAESIKQGRGCLGYIAFAFLLILTILGYSFSTDSLRSLPWYFWVFTVIVLVGGVIFVIIEVSFQSSRKNDAEEATVTIDLDSQRAVRVEKSESGEVSQAEIKLNEVSRVLIHCEEAGHSCKLILDLQNNTPFEVNSAYDFELNLIKELGKKLGGFLNRPIILKWTEGGKVTSEEEI